jgi:hypothetical protein
MGSLLTLFSFNTYRLTDFARLCEHHPNLTWSFLALHFALLGGGPSLDRLLLFFAWPSGKLDLRVLTAATIAAFIELVGHATGDDPVPPLLC